MSNTDEEDLMHSAIGAFVSSATAVEAIIDTIFRCELRHLPPRKAAILAFEFRNRTQCVARRAVLKELLRTYEDQDLISNFGSINNKIEKAFNFRNELLHNVIYRQEVTMAEDDFMEVAVPEQDHPTGAKIITRKKVSASEITRAASELVEINTKLIALYHQYRTVVEQVEGPGWQSKFGV